MHLQFLPIKKITGAGGYVDDPLPNIVYMAIWMPACIVWLYYAPSSTVWWFSDLFFCLVCGPLEIREKKGCVYSPGTGTGNLHFEYRQLSPPKTNFSKECEIKQDSNP